jgi:hypothetical protein
LGDYGIAKYQSQHIRQLEADMATMTWIARSGQPFSEVDEPHFKDFIKFWNPRVTVKHSTTFSRTKLPLLYDSVMASIKSQMEKELPHCNQVALTTDCWTSRAEDPFISLTLHYINQEFELKKFILNFDNFVGRHTGYHIAKGLDEMINQQPALANVSKKVIVHDAAANMKAGISQMEQNSETLLCGDHLLNTSLSHACNDSPVIKDCIKVATELSNKVRKIYFYRKIPLEPIISRKTRLFIVKPVFLS